MVVPDHVVKRLLTNVEPFGDCLLSLYSNRGTGYSQIGWHVDGVRVMRYAHRTAWEAVHGPIPDGLTVDHMCRNRRCINVEHLRLLTNVENARDNGQGRKVACPSGHPYDDWNTYITRRGHRTCRACAWVSRRKPQAA